MRKYGLTNESERERECVRESERERLCLCGERECVSVLDKIYSLSITIRVYVMISSV